MIEATVALAHSITKDGSKQSYYSLKYLADKQLADDALGAYAYFRWVDDFVDDLCPTKSERLAFIQRQKELIDQLYERACPSGLSPEEEILAQIIGHDQATNSKLQSYIRNMFAITEFDAHRKGRLISQKELDWYTNSLAKAVIDHLQHFICHEYPYPTEASRYTAAKGAHVAHMLRDMLADIANDYFNIPKEYLEANDINPHDTHSPAFRAWVRERVMLARRLFDDGKQYLDGLRTLRYKVVGCWYCARYVGVLDAIEREDYILRPAYDERHKPRSWLRCLWLGNTVALRHLVQPIIN